MNVEHLCLIDPGLRDAAGHHLDYAHGICAQMEGQGGRCTILAHRAVLPEVQRRLRAVPTFRYGFWDRLTTNQWPSDFGNTIGLNMSFFQDLSRALRRVDLTDWLLFMPTLDHHQLLAWPLWLALRPAAQRPRVVLMFRYPFQWADQTVPTTAAHWLKLGLRWLMPFVRSGDVRLTTESQRLSRQYARLLNVSWQVLPLPLGISPALSGGVNPSGSRPLRFITLGDARDEKGFGLIVEAIRYLSREQSTAFARLEFVLHCYISAADHAQMQSVRQALVDLRLPNVTLVEEKLPRAAYETLLQSADVVLLPFHRGIYYARTSGTLTEALSAAKVVITTADTWLSDQVSEFGAGTVVEDPNAGSLAQAILEAADRFDELSRLARQRQPYWQAIHNPANFVHSLLCGE